MNALVDVAAASRASVNFDPDSAARLEWWW